MEENPLKPVFGVKKFVSVSGSDGRGAGREARGYTENAVSGRKKQLPENSTKGGNKK